MDHSKKKGEKGPGAFIEKLLPRVGKRRLHKILDPFFLYFVGRALVAKAAGCRLGYILMHALLQLETFAYTFFSLHYVYGPKKKKKSFNVYLGQKQNLLGLSQIPLRILYSDNYNMSVCR